MAELHIVSTGKQTQRELVDTVRIVAPYADFIHIRERNWPPELMTEALSAFDKAGVDKRKLVVNGLQPPAVLMMAGGVQLPERELIQLPKFKTEYPELAAGVSVHSAEMAKRAEELGADRLIFGHIFETQSKPGLEPRGLEQLERVCAAVRIPVIAIGGIKPGHVAEVLARGASGIAVLSGIMLAEEPVSSAVSYREAMKL